MNKGKMRGFRPGGGGGGGAGGGNMMQQLQKLQDEMARPRRSWATRRWKYRRAGARSRP